MAERISDGVVLALLKQWLKVVVEEDGNGTRRTSGGKGQTHGTPQGGVISPLLANLHLIGEDMGTKPTGQPPREARELLSPGGERSEGAGPG